MYSLHSDPQEILSCAALLRRAQATIVRNLHVAASESISYAALLQAGSSINQIQHFHMLLCFSLAQSSAMHSLHEHAQLSRL